MRILRATVHKGRTPQATSEITYVVFPQSLWVDADVLQTLEKSRSNALSAINDMREGMCILRTRSYTGDAGLR